MRDGVKWGQGEVSEGWGEVGEGEVSEGWGEVGDKGGGRVRDGVKLGTGGGEGWGEVGDKGE